MDKNLRLHWERNNLYMLLGQLFESLRAWKFSALGKVEMALTQLKCFHIKKKSCIDSHLVCFLVKTTSPMYKTLFLENDGQELKYWLEEG